MNKPIAGISVLKPYGISTLEKLYVSVASDQEKRMTFAVLAAWMNKDIPAPAFVNPDAARFPIVGPGHVSSNSLLLDSFGNQFNFHDGERIVTFGEMKQLFEAWYQPAKEVIKPLERKDLPAGPFWVRLHNSLDNESYLVSFISDKGIGFDSNDELASKTWVELEIEGWEWSTKSSNGLSWNKFEKTE